MNRFYVYLHKDKNNNIRYVGKGCGRRAYKCTGRSAYWKNVFKYRNPEVVIYKTNLTAQEALDLEYKVHKYLNNRYKLCNLKEGGGVGFKFSDLSRSAMSKAKKSAPVNPKCIEAMRTANRGKKRDPEIVKKVADAKRGKKNKTSPSVEHRRKKGRAFICLNNGKVYYTTLEAAVDLNLNRNSIGKCVNGDRRCLYGYFFKLLKGE
jgi:hypothetical protein